MHAVRHTNLNAHISIVTLTQVQSFCASSSLGKLGLLSFLELLPRHWMEKKKNNKKNTCFESNPHSWNIVFYPYNATFCLFVRNNLQLIDSASIQNCF